MLRSLLVAGCWAAGFLALTLLVALHRTQGFDVLTRNAFRPGEVWGIRQRLADLVVEGLQPPITLSALLGLGALAARRDRRAGPLVLAVGLVAVASLLTTLVQSWVGRLDPDELTSHQHGSYPSGHVVAAVVCAGGVLLLRASPPRWTAYAAAGTGVVLLGLSLLLESAHWCTDVIGGLLLGAMILAAARAFLGPLWSAPRTRIPSFDDIEPGRVEGVPGGASMNHPPSSTEAGP